MSRQSIGFNPRDHSRLHCVFFPCSRLLHQNTKQNKAQIIDAIVDIFFANGILTISPFWVFLKCLGYISWVHFGISWLFF